jgi:hypothetical protein
MKKTDYYLAILITILLLLFFIYYFFLYPDIIEENTLQYNLFLDGVQLYPNVFLNKEIDRLKEICKEEKYKEAKQALLTDKKLNDLIHSELNKEYMFQDYIWIIKKSVVHTCHRDNNGDFFNENQMYPSYTMLIYLEDMEKCLGVIPKSHKDKTSYAFNITDEVINLPCKPGDVILFNANLIHVGCINKKDDNLRIQLKVTHKDDIPHIQYYQNFNKILNKDNHLPSFMRRAQRKLTCTIPALSDSTQGENIRTARGSSNGIDIGIGQQLFSYLFYGDGLFYDLPNAF